MPVFEYSGIDAKGKRASGNVDGENERAARQKLRKMGVFPTTLHIEGESGQKVGLGMQIDVGKYFQRVKVQDVALMTRQLSTLLASNIQLVEALNALLDQIENPKLKNILTKVRDRVTEGSKLSDAMKAHPKVFGDMYTNMINAGESSGALDIVCVRLSDFMESQGKLRSKVIGAMIYPAIMSVVGLGLMVMLLTYVVPKVTKIFEDVNATLPLPTRILMGASNALSSYWYLFALVIPVAIYAARRYLRTPKGREWWDRKLLTLPLVGRINRLVIVARFSRTLATLLASGVPLLGALDIVKNIITNTRLRSVIEQTRENVREGASIADPLKRSGEFPPLVTHMIAIGEKTGDLERMLERVADAYDADVDNTLSTLTTLLEPIMILVMAGVVSFIVLSILLPIMQLNQLG
ncbi:MAG: type II secretion system inner membrane protein GspF [Proteobacteria bacterium]|nr:type II secretion system inner membrane protein GspF [Pseudomonadota bacterium]